MKRIIAKANQSISVGWAAALLAGSSMVSMVLGLLRERLLISNFDSVPADLDAYRAAFKVPDFMFFILVSGALSVTFIPVLKERLASGNKKSAWELSSNLLNFLAAVTAISSLLLIIFADPLIRYVVAPGITDEAALEKSVMMMRIIAFNPFLFAISSVFTSIQQAVGRFFFFALAPSLYNVGIIIGILWFSKTYGIIGVAYGVILGSLLQIIVGAIGMLGLGFSYKPEINWRNLGFRKVLDLLPGRSMDQGLDYSLNLVEINRASKLAPGSINQWETAFNLHFTPINLIGIAISTAAFPQMSERLAQGRSDLFKKELGAVLKVIVWLAMGVAVVAFFVRGYLARLITGKSDKLIEASETVAPTETVQIISDLLGFLAIAIFARSVFHILSRAFYAQQDIKTPLKVSLFAVGANILLVLLWVRDGSFGIYGLAMAQSIMAAIEASVLLYILNNRFRGLVNWGVVAEVAWMATAAVMSAVVTYLMVLNVPLKADDVGFLVLVPKFTIIVSVGLASYLLFSWLLGVKEAKPVIERIIKIIFKPVKI